MSKRLVVVAGVIATAVLAIGSMALAQHGSPPTYIDAGGFTISMGVETTNGQVYHDNSTDGRSGQTCTSATADDGAGDNATECWNSRDQLKDKNVGSNQGGAVTCAIVPPQNVGQNQVVFDGVLLDECGAPSNNRGRVYTGVAVAGAGNGSLAAGGDVDQRSGCVQAFGEDDTPGNVIKTTTDTIQNARPGEPPHGGSDDDTDVTICGDGA